MQKQRDYILNLNNKSKLTDDIYMHRKVGDVFRFTLADKDRHGVVTEVRGQDAIVQSHGEDFHERGQTISQLTPDKRCKDCGYYFCTCEPNRKQNNMSKNNNELLTLAEVIAIRPGDDDDPAWINGEFEAVVSNVKRGKSDKAPTNATLSMASDEDVNILGVFWKRDDVEDMEGKLVRIGGKGLLRTKYKNQKSGKTVQQVSIAQGADVEVIGEAAGGGAISPPKRGSDAAERSSVRNKGVSDVEVSSSVEERLSLYERAFNLTEAKFGKRVSPDKVAEIATGICMSFRDGYIYRDPVFNGTGMSGPELESMPDKEWEADPGLKPAKAKPAEKVPSWRDAKTPKGKPLSELAEDKPKMLEAIKWAYTNTKDTPELKAYQANLLLAANEFGLTAKKTLAKVLEALSGDEERYSDEIFELYLKKHHKVSAWKAITEDEAVSILKDKEMEERLDECKKEVVEPSDEDDIPE